MLAPGNAVDQIHRRVGDGPRKTQWNRAQERLLFEVRDSTIALELCDTGG